MKTNATVFRGMGLALALGMCGTAVAGPGHNSSGELDGRDGLMHLTPWVVDAIKIRRGLAHELDWSRPDAPSFQEVEEAMNVRPTLSGPVTKLEADDYVLHYTTEGDDAVTDEIAQAAFDAIQTSWNREVVLMGYDAPPPDGNRGGDERYDFYFTQQRFTYGVTYADTQVDSNTYTSYIALGSWMDVAETQVTVAHEFFHAIHYTYDALEETWWFEVTATWMEEQVYDDINDYYNYVPSTMNNPEDSLRSTSNMYANSIYGLSLSEAFGRDIIRDIWERCSLSDVASALSANEAVVESAAYRGDFAEVLHNFRESMVDTERFEEGDAYGSVKIQAVAGFPIFDTTGALTGTGANVIQIPTENTATTLSVSVEAGDTVAASLLVGDRGRYTEIGADSVGGASWSVDDFGGQWDEAFVVLTNLAPSGDESYAVHVEAPGWGEGGGGCSMTGRAATGASAAWLVMMALGLGVRRRQ